MREILSENLAHTARNVALSINGGEKKSKILTKHVTLQLHDLRQMAAQRGYEIVHEFTDRISGTKAKRPGLDEMMRDARRGQFDVVLVWACDRIARSTRHFLDMLDDLNRLNVEFVSFRERSTQADRWVGPSWSSSERSLNSNAA